MKLFKLANRQGSLKIQLTPLHLSYISYSLQLELAVTPSLGTIPCVPLPGSFLSVGSVSNRVLPFLLSQLSVLCLATKRMFNSYKTRVLVYFVFCPQTLFCGQSCSFSSCNPQWGFIHGNIMQYVLRFYSSRCFALHCSWIVPAWYHFYVNFLT